MLDKARAENWLRHAVAAYMTEVCGDQPPAGLEGRSLMAISLRSPTRGTR
jgi:hypothetical protein